MVLPPRPVLLPLLLAVAISATTALAQHEQQPAPETPSNLALAEHLAAIARDTLRAPAVVEGSWSASAALLDGAARLAPDEPRFPRLLAEAALRTRDAAKAGEALSAYRRLRPDDQHAQVRQIDLYLSGMETADARVQYLRDVVDAADGVPPPVRSHAALRAARLLFERAQPTDAVAMLGQALELDPLNLEALTMRFELIGDTAPPAERLAALLQMVRANPAQPSVVSRVARELAAAGLVRQAVDWYDRGFNLHRCQGVAPGPELAVDFASELFLAGDAATAESLAKQLTTLFPEFGDAWFLRLVIARAGAADAAAQDKLRRQAAVALANRLAVVRREAGDATATTRPVDSPDAVAWPDPAADVELLARANRQDLVDAYADAAADLAWYRVYFESRPDAAAPWLAALRTLWSEQSPTVARLDGWALLQSGKNDDARAKLSPVADRDPLASLGLVKLGLGGDDAAKQQAAADARRLLGAHPAGVTGATIAEALKSTGAKPEPPPDQQAVAAELQNFPRDWLKVVDLPAQFYALRAEPVRVAHAYGEPMLLTVQVTNIGEQPITLGDGGLLRPDLWIDAQLRGVAQQPVPAVAYDRLAGPLVLKKGQSAEQVVRVDGGDLGNYLAAQPMSAVQLQFQVLTNPTSGAAGFGAGPAGYGVKSTRIVERSGAPVNSDAVQRRIAETMDAGTPEQKVRVLDLIWAYASALVAAGDADGAPAAAQSYRDTIRRATSDADPNVRAWAAYRLAALAPPGERAAAIAGLAGEPHWPARVLAVALAHASGAAAGDVVTRLADADADPVVRAYATAAQHLPPPAPSTQPATPPATAAPPR